MTSDGRFSVAFPRRWWYPVCRSSDLGRKPVGFSLMDTPLVSAILQVALGGALVFLAGILIGNS